MAPKVVLITGCSSGIGLATAVHLAKDPESKYKVYATMRSLERRGKLDAAAGDVLDRTLFVRPLDVTVDETVTGLVDDILREDGQIDVLVNNAGIYGLDGIVHKSLEWCQSMMDSNFWGAVRTIRAVLPSMQKRRSGRIINIGSATGINGLPFFSIYSASKFALEGYIESIAPVLRDGYNIWVSLIEPGGVATEMIASFYSQSLAEQSSGFDDTMRAMYVRLTEQMAARASAGPGPALQEAGDIAGKVQAMVEADSPHLRYQSSPAIAQMAGWKWNDPTGDSYLQSLK